MQRARFRRLSLRTVGACGGAPELGADDRELRRGHGGYDKVPQPSDSYTLFETLQVRPLALSPDGKRLFALNTPDNRLDIYKVGVFGLRHESSVSVGLEPIALAARSDDEVWVVNHLSDSVSIVDVSGREPSSGQNTLGGGRAARHRVCRRRQDARFHQHCPPRPELAGRSRSVQSGRWTCGRVGLRRPTISAPHQVARRLTKITLFADTPRALAATPDGSRVYAAPFFSGNQTTLASADAVRTVYASRINPANRNQISFNGVWQPLTSLVVKRKAGPDGTVHWYDAEGTQLRRVRQGYAARQ